MRFFLFLSGLCGWLLISSLTARAQADPTVVPGTRYLPVPADSLKFVALHVHFVQDYLGGGNFREQDDTTTHLRDENGYRWAQGLVWTMNWPHGWAENPPMRLFTGDTAPPAYPKHVQFVLAAVSFDRLPRNVDSTHQYYYHIERPGRPFYSNAGDDWLYRRFVAVPNQAIHVFVINQGYFFYSDWRRHVGSHHPRFDGGVMIRPDCVKISSPWFKAQGGGAMGNGSGAPWEFANILSHEIGHALGLAHTWLGSDGCPDTPTQAEKPPNFNCWADDQGECARQGIPASNNMMDYNNCQCALTPCQLRIIHSSLNHRQRSLVRHIGNQTRPVVAFCTVPPRAGRRPAHVYLDGAASFNERAYALSVTAVRAVGTADSLAAEPGWHVSRARAFDEENATPYGPGILDLVAQPGLHLRPNRVYRVRLKVWIPEDPQGGQEYVTWFDTYRPGRRPAGVQAARPKSARASATEKTGRWQAP